MFPFFSTSLEYWVLECSPTVIGKQNMVVFWQTFYIFACCGLVVEIQIHLTAKTENMFCSPNPTSTKKLPVSLSESTCVFSTPGPSGGAGGIRGAPVGGGGGGIGSSHLGANVGRPQEMLKVPFRSLFGLFFSGGW